MNRDTAIAFGDAPDLPITAPSTSVKADTGMTAGTDSHPDDPHGEALGRVRQVTLPPAARALSTLSRVDYEDAFLLETGPAQDRTGEHGGPGDRTGPSLPSTPSTLR
jgi:hypothetical protein